MESPSLCSVESLSFAPCVYEIHLNRLPPISSSPCGAVSLHGPQSMHPSSCWWTSGYLPRLVFFRLLWINRLSCLHVDVCCHFSWGNTQRRACRAIEKRIFNLIKPARLFPKWLRYFSPYRGGGLFAGVGNSLRITQQKEFRGNSADSSWCGKGN